MQVRYRLFFDESGDRGSPGTGDNPTTRHLALCGCVFSLEDEYGQRFGPRMDALKRKHFDFGERDRDNPVILHREDIINQRETFAILQNEDKRAAFDADLLELIGTSQYYLIVVVLDKLAFFARQGQGAEPHARCISELLERYCSFLISAGESGDVMGEARNEHLDRAVRAAYAYYHAENAPTPNPLTSKEIKLKPKEADIVGIQLADLLAHPTKQDILYREGLIGEVGPFTRQVCDLVRGKHLAGGGVLLRSG